MSAELLQVQEQLQRARDNLRHVEEGIKRTSVSSSHRFGDGGGRVAVGRRLGGMAGVQRFREEAEAEDEPPLKKSLSSVASRLGPILTGKKDTEEIDSESPAVKSTVTSTLVQNRENASSVASDTKTLDRSKRLFGSLLMGTLRQFKHDKETRKQGDIKQAEVLERVEKKEQEALAKTQQDRDKLVDAKDGVKDEIRLLEMQMELAELKVRAVEERDMLAQFIKTSTKPALYYTPKEHNHRTEKVLKDSNHRVNKIYEERISKLNKELGEVKRKLQQKKPIDERIGELSTIKLENLTKTIVNNDNSEKEEKTNNPITGIKVEVKLRESEDTVVKSESEDEVQQANGHVDEKSEKNNSLVNEKAGKTISRRSQSPRRNDRSPRRRSSPRRRRSRSRSAPRRRRSSPRSEHRRSEGGRRSRSPRRRSSPKSRRSASPKNRKLSRSKSPAKRNSSQTAKSPEHSKPKSPTKKESSRDTKSASPKKASKSQSKSRRSSSSADSSSEDDKQSNKKKSDREKGGSSGNSSDGSESD